MLGLVLQHQVLKEDWGKERGDHSILLQRGFDLIQHLLPHVPGEDWGERGTIPSSPKRVALNQSNQSLWYSTYCTMFLEMTEGEGMGDHPICLKGNYSDTVLTTPGSRRGLRRERGDPTNPPQRGMLWIKATKVSDTVLIVPSSWRGLRERGWGTIQSSSKGVTLIQYLLPQVPGEDWRERGTNESSSKGVSPHRSTLQDSELATGT